MIVNPGKFQAIIFDKHRGNHTNQIININQKEIKGVSKAKLLGIVIDDKLISSIISTFVNLHQTNSTP